MRTQRFSSETIDLIRHSISLPDYASNYTQLNKQNKGLCPFHSERNPSFSIDVKKKLWHCFGCQRGGDIFTFVMEVEDISFPSAVKLLAYRAGIRLPESESQIRDLNQKWEKKKKKIDSLNRIEESFRSYEIEIASYLRFKRKTFSDRETWTSKDYMEEQILDEKFDMLDSLIEERILTFDELRRGVRNGK